MFYSSGFCDSIDKESAYSELDKVIYEIKENINSNIIIIDSIMEESK